ncbi:unnamed protein product, partial [Prorocentrum cordatum]
RTSSRARRGHSRRSSTWTRSSSSAQASLPRVATLNDQAISNVAWAFARARHGDPELFDALAVRAASRVEHFTGQALSNVACAFAKVSRKDERLFGAIATAAVARLAELQEQHISNLAWAYAHSGCARPPLLFDALSSAALARVAELSLQSVSNVAWAFAVAGRDDEESSSRACRARHCRAPVAATSRTTSPTSRGPSRGRGAARRPCGGAWAPRPPRGWARPR